MGRLGLVGLIVIVLFFFLGFGLIATHIQIGDGTNKEQTVSLSTNASSIIDAGVQGTIKAVTVPTTGSTTTAWSLFLNGIDRTLHLGAYR